jgi:Winged helix DNA-binding domain
VSAGRRPVALRPAGSALEVAARWTLQDSPPGAAAGALAARVPGLEPGALERALVEDRSLVAVYNPRTATSVLPAAEVGAFTAAHLPADDAELRFLLGRAVPDEADAAEAVELTGAAVLAALDGAVLSRDDLHQALREVLPEPLLPWCEGCGSHHARRGLLVLACLRGELCLAGRAGRQVAFARPDQWVDPPPDRPAPQEASERLVRRFLDAYGPATPAHLAGWAGIAPAHAARLWALVDDADEAEAARDDEPHTGVVLLPPGDPVLMDRDRERLVADPEHRKVLWRPAGMPGAVLSDGAIAGAWRARKKGKRLEVTVEPFGAAVDRAALQAAADALAPHRGCTAAVLV